MPFARQKAASYEKTIIDRRPPYVKCGSTKYREVSRIADPKGRDSVMYECVECGDYRL